VAALVPADSFEAAAGRDSPVVGCLGNPVAAAGPDSLAEPVGRGKDRYKA
jgi:hypothetical protein